ncbi:fumarylacetoacetate hydrolase family protein [uncultured Xylophilus sp.]|uniref:fumarylacetoacetate hydrolase family protein n=1 Tax=uncultured Xylophilus sp. TaxID=296832 RepID=UPI0025F89E6D|nr:fumarylacetoacetate hydrolase family protein [uncultured Xylophilus sp.]
MKLATYQDGSRDGQLVVVSRDLASAHYATGIATRLQAVLEDWGFLSPQLQDLSDELNAGRARHAFAFDAARCLAPLPRAYEAVVCTAYPSHAELARQIAGDDAAGAVAHDPAPVRLGGADLLGPRMPIVAAREALGIDFGAGLAAITGDLPAGVGADRALDGIRLLTLANTATLRSLEAVDGAGGAGGSGGSGFDHHLAAAFGPVAATPDELAGIWQGGVLQGAVQSTLNGRKVGLCDAGADMAFGFGALLERVCRLRGLRAGSIVATGPVGNRGTMRGSRTDWPRGSGSIAEKRCIETLQDGAPQTPFLRFGDTVRIEMKGRDGRSLFGAIEQDVLSPAEAHERLHGVPAGA